MFLTILVVIALVLAGAATIAGGVYYLLREKQRAEREEQLHFRAALLQKFRRGVPNDFDFARFVDDCEVERAHAEVVAEDVYTCFCQQAITDGRITELERNQLDSLASALALGPEAVGRVERALKEATYRSAAEEGVLADGKISDQEAAELQDLQRRLGLGDVAIARATQGTSHDAYLALFRKVIRDGQITKQELEDLERYRDALGLSRDHANEIVGGDAFKLYRQWFYNAKQDGDISDEEERALTWLEGQFDLRALDLRQYHDEIGEIKRLSRFRAGDLPSRRTSKLLESGEICHWDGGCTFEWETATSTKDARGNLIVTNDRIVFTSPVKRFEFSPVKVMDIRSYSNGLVLTTSGRQGTGCYLLDNPRELEAIVYGLVRKHKYLQSENFCSSQSRHIPDSVKRSVWHRDGGKCVRCSAMEYLEYDHIIPHSRGGANTLNNVQVLCRNCNLHKSDRI